MHAIYMLKVMKDANMSRTSLSSLIVNGPSFCTLQNLKYKNIILKIINQAKNMYLIKYYLYDFYIAHFIHYLSNELFLSHNMSILDSCMCVSPKIESKEHFIKVKDAFYSKWPKYGLYDFTLPISYISYQMNFIYLIICQYYLVIGV